MLKNLSSSWISLKNILFHSNTPLWVSVIVLAISIFYSTNGSNTTNKVQIVQIQQTLRERYLNFRPKIEDELRIKDYPAIIKSYSEQERYQIRRYWSDIQFNEYITIKEFGRGILADVWDVPYGRWAADSLDKYQVLREEFCYFIENEKPYMGAYSDDFKKAILTQHAKHHQNEPINCDVLKGKRSEGTTTKKSTKVP